MVSSRYIYALIHVIVQEDQSNSYITVRHTLGLVAQRVAG